MKFKSIQKKNAPQKGTGIYINVDGDISAWISRALFAEGIHIDEDIIAYSVETPKKLVTMQYIEKKGWKSFFSNEYRGKIKSMIFTLRLYLRQEKMGELFEKRYSVKNIDKYIYEQIVRSDASVLTIDAYSITNLKNIFSYICVLDYYKKIFEEINPRIVIVYEVAYIQGAVAAMAHSCGARVIQCIFSGWLHELEYIDGINYISTNMRKDFEAALKKYCEVDNILSRANQLLEDKVNDIEGFDAKNAFGGKPILTKEQIKKEYSQFDASKNTIVIMAHAFSDSVCTASTNKLYKDYYTWFVETMKIISNIKNVNWIVKPHPTRHHYGENNEAKNIFEEYKSENMFWFDDEYNLASLYDIVDAAVTVAGTCGIEFPCYGINIICAGEPYYRNEDTIIPKTIEEYIEVLKNCDKLTKLNDSQIEKAKIRYWISQNTYTCQDEFDQLLVNASKAGRELTDEEEEKLYKKIEKYVQKPEKTWVFKQGEMYKRK